MQYDMVHPSDTVFNVVDDLGEICIFAEMPMSETQAINLLYVVSARNPVLLQYMWAWNCVTPLTTKHDVQATTSRDTDGSNSASANAMSVSAKVHLQISASLSKPSQTAHILEDMKTGTLIPF